MFSIFFSIAVAKISGSTPIDYELQKDIPYRIPNGDKNIEAKCKLDLYLPINQKNYATVIWFHGGGLTGGEKEVPEQIKQKGFAVVAAGYRLSPSVAGKVCIEDAAAAVAWTVKHLPNKGASPHKFFISGHSAGGYLASMIVLDKGYLKPFEIDPDKFAGLIPFSGHSITHFTIRKERGLQETQAQVDEFAPLFHVRKDAPPILLLSADREKELLGRYEESAFFWRMLKEAGHKDVTLLELQGYNHGNMVPPGLPLLSEFVMQRSKVIDDKP